MLWNVCSRFNEKTHESDEFETVRVWSDAPTWKDPTSVENSQSHVQVLKQSEDESTRKEMPYRKVTFTIIFIQTTSKVALMVAL